MMLVLPPNPPMFDLISKSIGSLVMLFAQLMISNAENLNVRVNSNIKGEKSHFSIVCKSTCKKRNLFLGMSTI